MIRMEDSTYRNAKPHAVCIPYPAQGHINPMMQLAKLLHHTGFYITFVHTEYNYARQLKSRGSASVAGLQNFRFEAIPDGLPVTPLTCIVSDASMSFTLDAAEEFGVPIVLLWTASACGLLGYNFYPDLIDRGLIPLVWRAFVCETFRASFEALDHSLLNSLQKIYKNVIMLPIGPLHISLNKVPKHSPIHTISASLWENGADCMTWLSSKAPRSVIYVNFGSITLISSKQVVEFAYGLANSKYPFLWIIRPDMVAGEGAILPLDFMDEIKGRGFLTSWCDQEQVLNHPAIGGFLTHCGWNSMIESISAGVPTVCWPFFAEQQTNCWFACKKWGIGMEMGDKPTRDEVEKLVGELMEGEKGKEMKRKVTNWKRLAEEAVSASGSSTSNFRTLVNQVLL